MHLSTIHYTRCRGIDFKGVRTVVNVHPPPDVRTYVHRVGRTGRAGQSGTAVSLLAPGDAALANQIEQSLSGGLAKRFFAQHFYKPHGVCGAVGHGRQPAGARRRSADKAHRGSSAVRPANVTARLRCHSVRPGAVGRLAVPGCAPGAATAPQLPGLSSRHHYERYKG